MNHFTKYKFCLLLLTLLSQLASATASATCPEGRDYPRPVSESPPSAPYFSWDDSYEHALKLINQVPLETYSGIDNHKNTCSITLTRASACHPQTSPVGTSIYSENTVSELTQLDVRVSYTRYTFKLDGEPTLEGYLFHESLVIGPLPGIGKMRNVDLKLNDRLEPTEFTYTTQGFFSRVVTCGGLTH